MLYSVKFRQNINMHGLLDTAGYLNTSYADPWWTESTLLQDTIGSHIKITINRKTDAANCTRGSLKINTILLLLLLLQYFVYFLNSEVLLNDCALLQDHDVTATFLLVCCVAISKPRVARSGQDLPSARLLSSTVHGDLDMPDIHTLMLMNYGQFVDHDMTRTAISSIAVDANGQLCSIAKCIHTSSWGCVAYQVFTVRAMPARY